MGTRKGAFILTSDGVRRTWTVDGPHFARWEIDHVKGTHGDPDRIYASQASSWFEQIIQRSDDGGATWRELAGMRGHESGPNRAPGAGGLRLHTIVLDPDNGDRIVCAISAAGAFRSVGRGADALIRVLLPNHLQTLAECEAEVTIDVEAPVTQARPLEALEQQFPTLRGTLREHGSLKRRPRVRFFVGKADVSLQSPDAKLSATVVNGTEAFRIVGAAAGG